MSPAAHGLLRVGLLCFGSFAALRRGTEWAEVEMSYRQTASAPALPPHTHNHTQKLRSILSARAQGSYKVQGARGKEKEQERESTGKAEASAL